MILVKLMNRINRRGDILTARARGANAGRQCCDGAVRRIAEKKAAGQGGARVRTSFIAVVGVSRSLHWTKDSLLEKGARAHAVMRDQAPWPNPSSSSSADKKMAPSHSESHCGPIRPAPIAGGRTGPRDACASLRAAVNATNFRPHGVAPSHSSHPRCVPRLHAGSCKRVRRDPAEPPRRAAPAQMGLSAAQ